VDMSTMNGEPKPVLRSVAKPLLQRGTKIKTGNGRMIVCSVGVATEYGN
jgi:magnesium-transporting ATPase (P-type)